MGLFDKLKGIVKGTQDAAAAQQHVQAPPQPEPDDDDDDDDADHTVEDDSSPLGDEPCTLERYAEIGGAQVAWAQQGRDVEAMLQQQFGMNALDWSNFSQFWSARIAGDYTLGLQCSEMQTKFEEQYKARGGALDDDLTR